MTDNDRAMIRLVAVIRLAGGTLRTRICRLLIIFLLCAKHDSAPSFTFPWKFFRGDNAGRKVEEGFCWESF
jgi:hypothetical protein